MADAVTSQTILDGDRLFIGKYTNISDGTGESAVIKINAANLTPNQFGYACNSLRINKIWAMTDGMGVNILWDATTDVIAITVPQNEMYQMNFNEFGGLANTAGAGVNGNILFTTVAASAGDRYTIILECIKDYVAQT